MKMCLMSSKKMHLKIKIQTDITTFEDFLVFTHAKPIQQVYNLANVSKESMWKLIKET